MEDLKTSHLLQKEAIALFFKVPEEGKVKTRLAKVLGKSKALQIYIELLAKTVKTIEAYSQKSRVALFGFYLGSLGEEVLELFNAKERWKFVPQDGFSLGERLKRAGGYLFSQGISRVLLIGADCPLIEDLHLDKCLRRLIEYPVVIIPSHDGGYVLLGINSTMYERLSILFDDLPFETPNLLKETLDRLRDIPYFLMPSLFDIDTYEDYERYLIYQRKFALA